MVRSKENPKPKVKTLRILSDDCVVYIGRKIVGGEVSEQGEPNYPHKGEWLEVLPIESIEGYLAVGSIAAIANEEIPDNEKILAMDKAVERLGLELARRVVAWNWTDWMGIPLPEPYGNPDLFRSLSTDELMYLQGAVRGETPGERKNA